MAYNSAYTGSQVDAAVGAVRQKETKWDNKQDELTGTEDQLVGFNSAGEATAVPKPTAADVGAMPAVSGGTAGQVLTKTEAGQEWQNAPDGLPSGGEEGQVLTKTASGAQWNDVPSDLPAGGTDGQILTKTADGVSWEDAPEGGVTSFNGRTGAVTPQAGDYTADMVGARADTWTPSAEDVGAVPTTRTVNGHALSANVTLDADDVGARPDTWTPTASDVGAVPTTRTINSKPLSSNVTLTADDVGAGKPATSATVTLFASSWTSSGTRYQQSVSVSGVTADSIVFADSSLTVGDNSNVLSAWSGIALYPATQGSGTLTFYTDTQPTVDVPVNVVVM